MTRALFQICIATLMVTWACVAGAHMPHDVVTTVAVGEDDRIVLQYEFRRRPMMVISDDDGDTWAFRAPEMSQELLTDLRFADGTTLYAADGVSIAAAVSEDGGLTWTWTASPDGTAVVRVAPAYGASPVVLAATELDVHRSDDAGDSWESLGALPASAVRDLAVSPGYPDDPFVAVLTEDHGLLLTHDDGETWDSVVLPSAPSFALALSPTFDVDDALWVATQGGIVLASDDRGATFETLDVDVEGFAGDVHDLVALDVDRLLAVSGQMAALCSDDAGLTWALCDDGITEKSVHQQGSWGHYRWVDGVGDTAAVAAWEGLMTSRDGGTSWEETCYLLPHYTRTVAFSPRYPDDPSLWIGSYGSGLIVTQDGGETWEVRGDDQHAGHVQAVAMAPSFPDEPVIFAVADRTLWRSLDGGESFDPVDLGEIASLHRVVFSLDFSEYGIAYALGASSDDSTWYGARTVDGGETWQTVWAGEEADAPKITHVLRSADPDSHAIYAAQTEPTAVLRSDSFGDHWDTVREFPDDELAAVFALPGDGDDRLLAVTGRGEVWQGSPAGDDWAVITELGTGALLGASGGGANPDFDGAVLYVATDPPGIVRSFDGGSTWEVLPSDLRTTINTMAFPRHHPDDPTVVVGTHFGTLATCDDGETWHLLDRLLRLEDDSCPVKFTGDGWSTSHGSGTGSTATRSSTAGDAAQVRFTGRRVRVLVADSEAAGTARVYADGDLVGEAQLSRSGGCSPVTAFEHEFAADGAHTLALEVVGDGEVVIDAIEVERDEIRNGADVIFAADARCLAAGDGCSGASCAHHTPLATPALLLAGLLVALAVRRR